MSRSDSIYDVAIAGLGAMGSACAAHLARRGMRVLGLDRHAPPHPHGSTHGRSRIIREGYFEGELFVPLVRRAFELWRELEQEQETDLLTIVGAILSGPAGSSVLDDTLASLRSHGITHEQLDPKALRARFPLLRADDGDSVIHEPGAGILRVDACVEAHQRSAENAGAELRYGEPVGVWKAGRDGVVLETKRGRYHAGSLVLALGPWLPGVMPHLPLRVERQVQVWFEPRDGTDCVSGIPVFLLHTADGRLLYGMPEGRERVKAAFHHGGTVGPFESLSRKVMPAETEAVHRALERKIPAAAGAVVDASVCFYTNTPDSHFLIDQDPRSERVWVVSPCSGHGFKFAPVVGERVGSWIIDGSVPEGFASFALGRFETDA